MDYASLILYCKSDRQVEIMEALAASSSVTGAAKMLNITHQSVSEALKRVKAQAAEKGFAPDEGLNKPTPEGYYVKGTTTLYDEDGKEKLQWVKTDKTKEDNLRYLRSAVEEIAAKVEGKATPVRAPVLRDFSDKLLTVLPMGDPHIGLYSWHQETGHDFDCEIAERQLVAATQRLVDISPASQECLILNLGDFFHSDNQSNRTARSGNPLDVDSRWGRVLQIGINIMIACIDSALKKHQKVSVHNCIGNHDDHSSVMLSLVLNAYYSQEPRVNVHLEFSKFFYHEFGKNLIGVTHGDMAKPIKLAGVMAAREPEAWGRTAYRYWMVGHIHMDQVWDFPGVRVEQFRTLAAPDAWTSGMGYCAGRDMKCIVLHKDLGEIERHTCPIALVE